jgi:solute:Na+ symporter, SSS family
MVSIGNFNAYYFSGVLFIFSALFVVLVSLMTTPPPADQIRGLSYGSQTAEQKAENRASWGMAEVIGSVVVLGLVVVAYVYFSYWLR